MKKIFEPHPTDFTLSAFLNWRMEDEAIRNMLAMAEGFMDSGLILMKECEKDNADSKADKLIFPVLTNVNHGIELYLKSMIWILNKLSESQEKFNKTHNLKQLLSYVYSKLEVVEDEDEVADFRSKTVILKSYIDELYEKINVNDQHDNIDFSRYPMTKKLTNHFYVDDLENVTVDIPNFIEVFTNIASILDDRISYYYFFKAFPEE